MSVAFTYSQWQVKANIHSKAHTNDNAGSVAYEERNHADRNTSGLRTEKGKEDSQRHGNGSWLPRPMVPRTHTFLCHMQGASPAILLHHVLPDSVPALRSRRWAHFADLKPFHCFISRKMHHNGCAQIELYTHVQVSILQIRLKSKVWIYCVTGNTSTLVNVGHADTHKYL